MGAAAGTVVAVVFACVVIPIEVALKSWIMAAVVAVSCYIWAADKWDPTAGWVVAVLAVLALRGVAEMVDRCFRCV